MTKQIDQSVVEVIEKRLSDIELSPRPASVSEKESTEDQIDASKNAVNESLDELKDRDARKVNLVVVDFWNYQDLADLAEAQPPLFFLRAQQNPAAMSPRNNVAFADKLRSQSVDIGQS